LLERAPAEAAGVAYAEEPIPWTARPRGLLGLRIVFILGLLGAWEMAAGRLFNPFWTSQPSAIAAKLFRWVTSGYLSGHLGITFLETILGFIIGAAVGVVGGLVLGRNPLLGKALDPYIMAVYSLPKISLAPLFVLWFGLGLEPKVTLAAFIVFFLVFYNTYSGAREVDPDLLDVVRTMGGRRAHLLLKVVLPSAGLWIFNGLKMAFPYALHGAVIGELISANQGLGYLISYSKGIYDTTGIFAALFVLMFVAVSLNELLARIESYAMRWKVIAR